VALDDSGRAQAEALAQRLAAVPLVAIRSSPVQRCLETAQILAAAPGPRGRQRSRPPVVVDEGLSEVDYGDWTDRPLRELARESLWDAVQAHPSAVTFPSGESLRGMQARAVDAVRSVDAAVAAAAGDGAVWVAVSHGDVIKAVLADALGVHLDAFQRIVVDPCSVSAVRFTGLRPFVLRTNDTGGDLGSLVPTRRRRRRSAQAVVGGGTGDAGR
jgi:probable phosphomutase (TIGR03848 family)